MRFSLERFSSYSNGFNGYGVRIQWGRASF